MITNMKKVRNNMKKNRTLVLVILSLIAGMAYLTPLIRFSFYDQMKEAMQLTDVQIGSIGAIYGVFNVACYVPSGILAEKFNTKKLLIISTFALCLVTIWYSFYPGFQMLLVIHALYGVFSVGTFWSPYLNAIRHLGSEEEQGRIFGISEGLRGIGQTVVAFGCLAVMGLFASTAMGFRSLLWINAVVFFLLMLAVIFFVPDFDKEDAADSENKKSVSKETKEKKKGENALLKTITSPSTWICIFVILCGYTVWNTVNGYIGTYCTRVLNIPAGISSTLSIVRSYIIVFAAGLTGGFFIDRFKAKGSGMMIVFLSTGICTAGVFLTHNLIFLCVGVTIILSYLVNVIKSTYWSILGDAGVPLHMTGIATGVISLIGLTPDIFVAPVVSRFIAWGESAGNLEAGFNLMLVWLFVWSILGVGASFILKLKKEKVR
jgi:predicted MFS family arabinose efflux permease